MVAVPSATKERAVSGTAITIREQSARRAIEHDKREKMNFQESVKTCFTKYVDFNGRASRSEYWWFVLFIFAGDIVLYFAGHSLPRLFELVTLLPSISAATRRLHDTNRSGWMQVLLLIPLLGWAVVIYFLVQEPKEPNKYGAAPAVSSETVAG
jgi:uncharacterized membrane protein YhaH (DUF805 family)